MAEQKITGLEGKFLRSWKNWDEAGDYGDIQFYNEYGESLALTEFAEKQLARYQQPDNPFVLMILSCSKSYVEFMRNDNSFVRIDIELAVA